MAEVYTDEVAIRGTPVQVWAFLDDHEALGRVLPGCERIERTRPGVYSMVLALRHPLVTVRADAIATLEDPEPPTRVRLTIEGAPPGFSGKFRLFIPFELEGTESPNSGPVTRIRYGVAAELTGSIALFGVGPIQDGVRRQIAELAANVEREIAAGRTPGESTA